jgi:signal transduction histidine kinase
MRRLRLALAVLMLALALPIALLVGRALQSVAFEERVRHETVAARVFDEMERSLSDFLEREEARPIGAYGFYGWRDAAGDGATQPPRSPLSRPASEPFVIAHFQIDPDGSWHSPLRPRDTRLGSRFGDWPAAGEERERVERGLREIETEVVPFWQRMAERQQARDMEEAIEEMLNFAQAKEETAEADRVAPGTLARPQKPAPKRQSAKIASKAKGELAEAEGFDAAAVEVAGGKSDRDVATPDMKQIASKKSTYDVLQSFNRGAEQRRERKAVVTEEPRLKKHAAAPARPAQKLARPSTRAGEAAPAPADKDAPAERTPVPQSVIAPRAPASEPTPYASSPSVIGRAIEDTSAMLDGLSSRSSADYAAETQAELDLADDEQHGAGAAGRADARVEESIRIVREPMVGVALGPEHVMLYRTVLVDQQGYRQGLLIDANELGRWLEERVIAASPLRDSVVLAFGAEPATPAVPADYYISEHTFAEPFDTLAARLAVEPLAGGRSADTIYALAALLVIVALGGLLAVDRMVTVVVHFAERRNNFVAAVSHELKTPLTAIRMYGEMLRDGLVPSEEKRHEYYGTISDESERLSRLIDNVLEFSRLEKGNREFNMSAGAIGGLVEEIADKMRPHALREGFELRVEVEPDLPPVRFDRDALFQMIFNLVDNAMKYAKSAERHDVVVQCGRDERGSVQLSVRDYGPGVSRRVLGKVFEPFFRGEDELTRTAKGSGIGLALVKELGESMGAAVSGANVEGGGFRVSIAFPAVSA